ncbi:YacL family protein [Amphritea atlantica]|uniref:YacL family protein n=1 Tax=Amphritea atlantica TaxID=355243 RepID=A0ABY5GVA7_9GAMM|nr:YacL family protein [Amphritea atlantica]
MDYDFTHDIYGAFRAEFSMGHEALGYWLTYELRSRQTVISELLTIISELQNRQRMDYLMEGSEYNLLLSRDEAVVRAHALDSEFEEEQPDDNLVFYDQESTASCGLDDFIEILEGWQQFTSTL